VTIIEVRGRGGQLLGRLSTDRPEVRIGRAFSNDLIVDDPYVDAHHLRLIVVEGGWESHDLGSRNGMRHRSAGAGADALVRSGDTLRIGYTVLRVYNGDHPVPPALPRGGWEDRLSLIGRYRIWPALAGLTILVSIVSAYLNSWDEIEPQTFLGPVAANLGGPLLFAVLWALLGRLLRHRAQLMAHFGIWLSIGLLSQLTTSMAGLAGFNAGSEAVETILNQGTAFVLLAGGLWCSLLLATNLRARGRWLASIAVAAAFVSIGMIAQYQMRDRFFPSPRYYTRLAARTWLWARPVNQEALIDRLPLLVERAGKAIIKEDPAGEATPAPPPSAED
jgi:Inner membrane component of T3SS, cytoplasmic domain